MLDTVREDVRYALRTMGRSAGFTAVAVVALALGIGASAAIFSVLDAVLVRPLPYDDAGRLVVVLEKGTDPVSAANLVDWRRAATSFSGMAAAEYWTPDVTGGAGAPETVRALQVEAGLFPLLGVAPLLGRTFSRDEGESGERVAVLSYDFWQRRFGGDRSALGQKLLLNGAAHTVVGVMPKGFAFAPFWATNAQLFAPLAISPRTARRDMNSLRVFARLADDATLASARAQMAAITARLETAYPGTNRNIQVLSLTEKVVGDVRPALLVLMGAVGFVLLTACANVAHMLLARAATRRRELAVRRALGASRGRVVRQLLAESLLLALAGGAAGVLVASAGIRLLLAASPGDLPRIETVALDGRVLAFTFAVSVLSALLFGLAPALRASDDGLSEALKEGERGSTEGIRRNRLRSNLVASEFALALVLLVGAGLMLRTLAALQAEDPGFASKNVLTAVVSVAGSSRGEPGRRGVFFTELLERVRALPGVVTAGAINHLPLAGDQWGYPFLVEGRPKPAPGEGPAAVYRVVLPGYLEAMGIRLVRGRAVAARDDLAATRIAVVNERFAARYFPNEDPIGKRITFGDLDESPAWVTIVGVSRNAKQESWRDPAKSEIYVPYLQDRDYLEKSSFGVRYLTLVAKTTGDPAALAPALREAALSLDGSVVVSQVQTMDAVVRAANGEPRFYLLLLGAFAGTALVLAAAGIYGVMSHSIARRRHEIGIRIALGARPRAVVRLVVRQAMTLAFVGALAGICAALLLTRFLTRLLYGVGATDPLVFAVVPLLLAAVALGASFLPARRASRIDPAVALRSE
jgi:predicted permease